MQEIKVYDLIFSIGEACSCTECLRFNKLQDASYPFDWIFGATFLDRIKILTSKFDNFLNLKDLTFSYSENSISCDAYKNNFNNLTFNHDFPKDIPLSSSYNQVKEKYNRRINRLLNKINTSQNVLLVYIETPMTSNTLKNDGVLHEAQKFLEQAFPGTQCDILYITHDETLPLYIHNYVKLSDKILKVALYNKSNMSGYPEDTVNPHNLIHLFKKYQLYKNPPDIQVV